MARRRSDDGVPTLKNELSALCARYLLEARRNEEPLEPVARFHLANGVRIERLNWMGDTSKAGLERSVGLMVNYVYRRSTWRRTTRAYAARYEVIAPEIERLARRAAR